MKKLLLALALALSTASAYADITFSKRWLDYFNEGDSIKRDGGPVVTTRKPKEKAGAYLKTGYWTWDLNKSVMSFKVKASNWKNTSVVSLVVGNGLQFNDAATVDIRQRLVNAPNDEWVEMSIPFSAWHVDGNIKWDEIDAVLFIVADNGIDRVTAQLSELKAAPASVEVWNAIPRVSITVDDGLTDTMIAAKIMGEYGFAGTAFIDVDMVGSKTFIDELDLIILDQLGWDVSGHHMGALPKMEQAALVEHIGKTSDFLSKRKFRGSNLYALPNGARNTAVNEAMQDKFKYVFNIDGMANSSAHIITSSINRHSIDKHTLLELAKKWIDDAIVNNEWVVINFHTFSDTWEREEDWTVADFRALLDYIKVQNIQVVPASKVVN